MRRRSAFVVGLVTASLVVGASSAPVLAASAAPAASAPVRGVWLPARELPGTSLASGVSSVDAVACAPGAECVTADDTFDLKTGADVSFLLSERNGNWGNAQQIPGLAALAGPGGQARINSMACPASGYCLAVGTYGFTTSRAFVAQETRGAWGKPAPIPGLNAMDTARAGSANLVSCPSVGNCTVAGDYGTGSNNNPVPHEFVASEASGHWHDAAAVPGLDALAGVAGGGEAEVTSLSCASAVDCALGGTYMTAPAPTGSLRDLRHDLAGARPATQFSQLVRLALARPQVGSSVQGAPFVAGEVGGTWGDATVPAIPGLTSSGGATVTSVACPAAGDCVVGGAYSVSASSNAGGGFYVTQNGTGWSTPITNSTFAAEDLACTSAGNCMAAGSDVKGIAAVQREESGSWGTPAELPGAASLAYQGKKAAVSAVLSLACPSAGNCSAIGLYATGSATNPTAVQSFVASAVNGPWSAAQVPPGLASLGSSAGLDVLTGLACASAANCLAGGPYSVTGSHGGLGAFELTELPVRPTGTLIGLSAGTVVYGTEQAERVSVKVTAHL
ncbi:MAG: hypothetical protein JWM19_6246, partial [Actinomycetia bacterium]|nr:hypothetical protein [Actinomycetes bacterium]